MAYLIKNPVNRCKVVAATSKNTCQVANSQINSTVPGHGFAWLSQLFTPWPILSAATTPIHNALCSSQGHSSYYIGCTCGHWGLIL